MYIICKYSQKWSENNFWNLPWRPHVILLHTADSAFASLPTIYGGVRCWQSVWPHVCTLYQIMYALTSFREWSVPDSGSPHTI